MRWASSRGAMLPVARLTVRLANPCAWLAVAGPGIVLGAVVSQVLKIIFKFPAFVFSNFKINPPGARRQKKKTKMVCFSVSATDGWAYLRRCDWWLGCQEKPYNGDVHHSGTYSRRSVEICILGQFPLQHYISLIGGLICGVCLDACYNLEGR